MMMIAVAHLLPEVAKVTVINLLPLICTDDLQPVSLGHSVCSRRALPVASTCYD